ncbi:hypothetical protein ES707_22952 [subsurface metagenome]
MKNLGKILRPTEKQFPVTGENGYAGQSDGTAVEFIGVLHILSRKEAMKIEIGDAIGIHWARYIAFRGWEVSLAHWDNADEEDCVVRLNDAKAHF